MTNKYDPNKRYNWKSDEKFEMSGHQFGTMLNAFRGILGTREAQGIIAIYHANEIIEELMASGVEKGIVVESVQAASGPSEEPHKLSIVKPD